jgi:large subunit ribosomal protein L19
MQAVTASTGRRLTPFMARQSGSIARHMSTGPVELENMPYLHHGQRPRNRVNPKFKSPQKRASKLLDELNKEAVEKSKEANPVMWKESFRVGDSIELNMVSQGGIHKDGDNQAQEVEKVRGVVLGVVNRGLGSSVILRDVVYGQPIERKIPLHSPMIKDATVLERNFIFKGKKKVKRAKLYYFRDLNPLCKCIPASKCSADTLPFLSNTFFWFNDISDQGFKILSSNLISKLYIALRVRSSTSSKQHNL